MAADQYEQAYHLTHNGWEKGAFAHFRTVPKDSPAPSGRVLTVIKEAEQSCGFAPTEFSWREDWRSSEATPRRIASLRKKFGEYPRQDTLLSLLTATQS